MEIRDVTSSMRMCAHKYAEMSIEARHGNNIDWGRVSLLNQFSGLLERLAGEIDEDIMFHFEPKEVADTQERLEADIEKWAYEGYPGVVIDEVHEFLRRQRELDEKYYG